tara:strand:+ start:295 stop:660 length:366 start_codon:yes stop_codon:yes gene_type:complete
MDESLQRIFPGFALRDGQRQVIAHILEQPDGDVVCTFPTGYGKSLCYIVPVEVLGRACVVVSPLCSLIQVRVAIRFPVIGAKIVQLIQVRVAIRFPVICRKIVQLDSGACSDSLSGDLSEN